MVTQKRLKELLHYNSSTGVFTWRHDIRAAVKKGDAAGTVHIEGYVNIKVDGKSYAASRLAWLYMEGYWPENDIDHIDRIRANNKWKNLRHVSKQCNIRNRKASKNNKSGVVGVRWSDSRMRWESQIMVNRRMFFLGRFISMIDAVMARWNAEVKHNFHNCNTASTSYLYLKKKGAIV